MGNENILDNEIKNTRAKKPLVIKIVCITGMIFSLFEIFAGVYTRVINSDNYENEWTIYLMIIPFINLVCWVGFLTLRKATLILYCLNYMFLLWVHFHIGVPIIDFYTLMYFVAAVIMLGQLHRMTRFI